MKKRWAFCLCIVLTVISLCSCTDELKNKAENCKIYLSKYDKDLKCGSPVLLLADATNKSSYSYTWYVSNDIQNPDFEIIEGETDSTLTTENFKNPEARYYRCVISKDNNSKQYADFFVAYTGLPTLEITGIDCPISKINKKEYKKASIKIYSSAKADRMNETEITIKGRGNSSWFAPKKGYNIKFNSKTSVLDMNSDKKWCLISNYYDSTYSHNALADFLGHNVFSGNDSGEKEFEPSYRYVDVIMDGVYMGNYILSETVKINKKRINIENIEDHIDNLAEGGFLVEADFRRDATWTFNSYFDIPFVLKDPDFDDFTKDEVKDIVYYEKSTIDRFEKGISKDTSTYKNYIDEQSFVNWYIIEELAKNVDADFNSSVYIYYNPKDKLIHMGPDWDIDIAFGSRNRHFDYKNSGAPEGFWINAKSQNVGTNWFELLMKDSSFASAVREKFTSASKDDELLYSIENELSRIQDEIGISVILDQANWHYSTYKTFSLENNISTMLDWIEKRINWLNDNL